MIKFLFKALLIVVLLILLIPLVKFLIWLVSIIFGGVAMPSLDVGVVFFIGCVVIIIVCLRYLFSD